MKFTSTIVAASIAIGAVVATGDIEHIERALILRGKVVPPGSNTYMTGIRTSRDGDAYCGGVLINESTVLTTALCCGYFTPKFAAVGTHYLNGTMDGEVFKIVSVKNHTLFNLETLSYNFAALTLEKSSKYKPILLPGAGLKLSDVKTVDVLGWGYTNDAYGDSSYELRSATLKTWRKEDCDAKFDVGNTSFCAGGVAREGTCIGDQGGPAIKKNHPGDSDDVLIGLTSWGYDCGIQGSPTVFSNVSDAIPWINSVISKKQ